MTVSLETLAAFRAMIGEVPVNDDPKYVQAKSRDYYWYSPILKEQLDAMCGQLVVQPRTEAEVIAVASACASLRIPLTLRGGGTGNYGQCVPMDGGVVMEMTRLDRVLEITPGRVVCEAGARIEKVEHAVAETGQMLSMFPSTKRLATMAGFVSGGSGGIGSLKNGMLRDGTNITYVRLVTVEGQPRVIELRGAEILKVQHAYGTNGIITALDYGLTPAVDYRQVVALFDGYDTALRVTVEAEEAGIESFLLTVCERRFSRFYKKFDGIFPPDKDAVFAMVAPDSLAAFQSLVAASGGAVVLVKTDAEMDAAGLPPVWECGWNHTTLQALKVEPGVWTYLQVAYAPPLDFALCQRQLERYGEEIYWHHETARMAGEVHFFALPIVRWTSKERIYQIIAELEAEGCAIYDPHAITIEDGGMKAIDTVQIDFKMEADPHGLMNPGKTKGWTAEMAR
ncbi:MAG: FAD-binding oxidoreductase [Rhodobacter sp.]|nr:FAD-binding oxidoreductase [Rhodobacter sp.]